MSILNECENHMMLRFSFFVNNFNANLNLKKKNKKKKEEKTRKNNDIT